MIPLTMTFKSLNLLSIQQMAVAYYATGDIRFAKQSAAAIRAWAVGNKAFGLNYRNGPLEAAWGCGAMARAAELLRADRGSGFGPAQVGCAGACRLVAAPRLAAAG
jgi:hypothetical protein